ncbi:MAG: serine/threonine protein kinase [Gaiellales bacterium]|nr:serine/threonine protein kinase [Gaiellales bacterium]
MESLVGRRLGKYELTTMIGGGGMATVYQARHPGLGQQVAVKILHPFLSTDTSFIDRFRREAHAVAALRHPNIVRVLDFDHDDDLYYMVMEHIGGPTLSSIISARKAAGGLSLPEIRRIFPPLCGAVDYAAGRGMIHRDIKPANIIMSEDGEPILTDYGIAKMIGATALTSPGTVVGSAHYMSPEQAQGYDCDVRSDLYSLGIVLFEALSGTVPFDGDTTVTVLLKHVSAPIPSIRALRPNLPPALEVMLARALAKHPQDRYEMGDAFADELLVALTATRTVPTVTEPVISTAPAPLAFQAPAALQAQTVPAPAAAGEHDGVVSADTVVPWSGGAAPMPPTVPPTPAAVTTRVDMTRVEQPGAAEAAGPAAKATGAEATATEASVAAEAPVTAGEGPDVDRIGAPPSPAVAPAPLAELPRDPGRRNRMRLIIVATALVVIAAGAVGAWLGLKANDDDSTLSTTTSLTSTPSSITTSTTALTTTSAMSTTTTLPTTTIATTTTATTATTARPTTTVRRTTTTARPVTTSPPTTNPPTTSPPDTIGPGTTGPPDTIGPG